jgi:type I restriction enzyme S subunit
MKKNWKIIKLSESCSKIGSGATPTGGKEAYLKSGPISLIRSQNVLDFSFTKNGLAFISPEQAYELKNVTIEEDDVLLNITGDSVARVCKVPKDLIPARVNQHVAIIRPQKDKIDSDYLKYYLLEPSFKGYLLGLASSGATGLL